MRKGQQREKEKEEKTRTLQHVRVRPAAGVRQLRLVQRVDSAEVTEDGSVGGAHVARGAVEIPGAALGGRQRGIGLEGRDTAPMAVLDGDVLARGGDVSSEAGSDGQGMPGKQCRPQVSGVGKARDEV